MNAKFDDWEPCPRGEIGNMVQGIRAARKQVAVARVAAIAVVVLLVGIGVGSAAWLGGGRVSDDVLPVASITCHEAVALFDDYERKTLTESMERRVANHLEHCEGCRNHFRQRKESGAGDTTKFDRPTIVVALGE